MSAAPVAAVTCLKRPSGEVRRLKLRLRDLRWTWQGPRPPAPLSPAARDLLEVVRTVHEIDRRMPRRISADRVRRIEVHMDLRAPHRWKGPAMTAIVDLLAIMGNVEWSFSFGKRGTVATSLDELEDGPRREAPLLDRPLNRVVLFSGGLDSTSGLATLRQEAAQALLVSYYTGNLAKQQEIARRLGFPHLTQIQASWSREGVAAVGGQFWYRSLLYLAIGAVVADAAGVSTLIQFENGPLAFGIPPAPIYRMTRHAHPAMHRAAERVFKSVLGREIQIENPFLLSTKREAVAHLRRAVRRPDDFRQIVARTETCWHLKARRIVGKAEKRVGEPCGACIPCIVRRAALGTDDVPAAVDFAHGKGRWTADPCVRVHLDACLAFADRLLSRGDPIALLAEMPVVTEAVIADGRAGVAFPDVRDLYLRFAKELRETFP